MKKVLFAVPLTLALYACGAETEPNTEQGEAQPKQEQTVEQKPAEKVSLAAHANWEVDERLQEPTEDTICAMCNMKVYTRDHEQGVFSAQAVREDGSVVFYDDIGCLLNDEYANNSKNEKFVRDYTTLNWFDVEQAIVVKTDLKSPMNWGYIFFKYEEDANAYLAENQSAKITPLEDVRAAGIERYKQKQAKSGNAQDHNHEHSEGNSHEQSTMEEMHN